MSTPDLQAPHWLRQLLSQKPVPLPWKRSIRAAPALAGPIGLGMLLGCIDLGVLVSIGALCVTFADADGPYRYRAQRTVGAGVAGLVGYTTGSLTGGHPVLVPVVLVVVAGVSALISATGSTASLIGLQLLVFTTLGTGQAADPRLAAACFAVGVAYALVLALAAWPVRGAAVERRAVAQVYDDLAAVLAASGTAAARPARRTLTQSLNSAYDALLDARSHLAGRDRAYRRLFVLLTETTPAIEASVALVNAKRKVPQEFISYLHESADNIRRREPLAEPPEPPGDSREFELLHTGLLAVVEFRRGDTAHDARPAEERLTPGERLRGWLDRVITGRVTWLLVLRLMLCVGLAVLAGRLLPLEHSFWVVLTVAIVLKPDFGSVFGRAVLRGVGTAVGVLLGAGVLALDPPGWGLVLLVVAVAAALPIGQVRNYGMFSTFVTPLVIVQLDLANAGNWGLVGARLLDTVLGCAIVLVFGYLLWPGSRRPRVGEDLAATLDVVAEYVEEALSRRERSTLRRSVYRALSDLRTAFQQSIVEPSAAGRAAAAWWPVIIGLERLADAVTGLAVAIERGASPVPAADIACLAAAVREAAAAVRGGRSPRRDPLPDTGRLERVVAELVAVQGTLRGPELVERGPRRLFTLTGRRRRARSRGSAR
ncbi:FUSC family protein [Actinokineospora spheciospongiae]|uniref:FUSC family protein n=1 Tax=Actinokineospora spheciospongiae TaxID=909613 RepID=UPI000D712E44|nr:FUSC family protein [Actinokineospora spheciospongiae]PWW62184.1 putative membrane protein YccC [Actinokineospora spheciospongiae]